MPTKKEEKPESFFKQTWVQVVSTIIAAVLGGLITFFAATSTGKSARADEDHDKLIKVEADVGYNKEAIDEFVSQFGELKGVVDELKWTSRQLSDAVDRLEGE